jgi:hypothetical protein
VPTATVDGNDSDSDSGNDALAAIQGAVASGSISSVKGQQLENRIAAIERLAATDPGLDVNLLENDVLAALPAQPAPTTNVMAATSANDPQQSSGATPTVTVAAPVNTSAAPAAFVETAPATPTVAVSPTSSSVQQVAPLPEMATGTSSTTAAPVITTASQPTHPPQPGAIVPSYPRDSLLSQLFEQLGEDMSGVGIHFGGPTNGSSSDFSWGDTTVAGPAEMGQITTGTVFETLGLDFVGRPGIGSRHASRSERIILDSVDSDWSDDFLSAVSAFGDSSRETD